MTTSTSIAIFLYAQPFKLPTFDVVLTDDIIFHLNLTFQRIQIYDLVTGNWFLGATLPSYITDPFDFSIMKCEDTVLILGKHVHKYDIDNDSWIEMEERPQLATGYVALNVTGLDF